jgi:hypothetical protein
LTKDTESSEDEPRHDNGTPFIVATLTQNTKSRKEEPRDAVQDYGNQTMSATTPIVDEETKLHEERR